METALYVCGLVALAIALIMYMWPRRHRARANSPRVDQTQARDDRELREPVIVQAFTPTQHVLLMDDD